MVICIHRALLKYSQKFDVLSNVRHFILASPNPTIFFPRTHAEQFSSHCALLPSISPPRPPGPRSARSRPRYVTDPCCSFNALRFERHRTQSRQTHTSTIAPHFVSSKLGKSWKKEVHVGGRDFKGRKHVDRDGPGTWNVVRNPNVGPRTNEVTEERDH